MVCVKRSGIAFFIIMALMLFGSLALIEQEQAFASVNIVSGAKSIIAQSQSEPARSAAFDYKYHKQKDYTFIPKYTGIYRLQDHGAHASVMIYCGGEIIRSIESKSKPEALELEHTSHVKLEKGKKYTVLTESIVSLAVGGAGGYGLDGTLYIGYAEGVKPGEMFTIGGVTYKVTSADPKTDRYTVAVVKAKNVKTFKKGWLMYKGLCFDIGSIDKKAFFGSRKLKYVSIISGGFSSWDSRITVGSKAFSSCPNLKEVTIPASAVGPLAFSNCPKLYYVRLSYTEKIGSKAFSGDEMLSVLRLDRTPKASKIKKSNFQHCLKGSLIDRMFANESVIPCKNKAVIKIIKIFSQKNSGRKISWPQFESWH